MRHGALKMGTPPPILIIACGALAREIIALRRANGWQHVDLRCLNADLHNRPKLIAGKVREKIAFYRDRYDQIFIAYADCGTGGDIDRVLEETGIERLPGAHCYSFYSGEFRFKQFSEQEPGTFYLTDFLAENFVRIVIGGLGVDDYPDLLDDYFANYRRVLYLSQTEDDRLLKKARVAAQTLGLEFEHHHCGYGELELSLKSQVLRFE